MARSYALEGKLTITDGSENKDGKIVNNNVDNAEANTLFVGGGSATLENGTIVAEGKTDKSVMVTGGTFTMDGGKLTSNTTGGYGISAGLGSMYGGVANVNGGEISGSDGVYVQQGGTLNVKGGKIVGTGGVYHNAYEIASIIKRKSTQIFRPVRFLCA